MSDPSASTSELLKALPALEASLGALKEKSWEETTDALEGLDRAKIDVLLSYAINDLIWVYLKLKGIDPATHDVSSELERIKKYYTKIQSVEHPPQRTSRVDVDAARRFITHSIPRSQRTNLDNLPSTSAAAQAADDIVRIGDSGDTSLAGRFRFISQDAEKVTRDDDEIDLTEEKADGMDIDQEEETLSNGNDAEAFMKDFEMELEQRQVTEPSADVEDQSSAAGSANSVNVEAGAIKQRTKSKQTKSKGKKRR